MKRNNSYLGGAVDSDRSSPGQGKSHQWRSEGIWRPGANLNFAPPPPSKKFLNKS